MALWVAAFTGVALLEPNVGCRFAPDLLEQGVLACSPSRSIKVQQREDADYRLVAVRLAGRAATGGEPVCFSRAVIDRESALPHHQPDALFGVVTIVDDDDHLFPALQT